MADDVLDLYREAILAHARDPHNATPVAEPDVRVRVHNPLCGDELELTLALVGGSIRAIGVQVRGCAIAQASASLMSEAVRSRDLRAAVALGEGFRALMVGDPAALPPELESLRPLEAVRHHRSRIACTLLAWDALREAAEHPA
jgi:nitrogen fixation NifU-like protein